MGEEVSTREIKKILQDEIEKENKRNPLTDEELTEVLKTRGYPIAPANRCKIPGTVKYSGRQITKKIIMNIDISKAEKNFCQNRFLYFSSPFLPYSGLVFYSKFGNLPRHYE